MVRRVLLPGALCFLVACGGGSDDGGGSPTAPTPPPRTANRTANFALQPIPLFSRSGTGNNVFDMPTHVRRVRITGTYARSSENFIVWIGNDLVVNELLGTFWGQTRYEGVHATTGGLVEITNSSGVNWTFTEER